MLCPNCGEKALLDQKFCRSCGMNLEPISKALVRHQSSDAITEASKESAQAKERRIALRMIKTMSVGGMMLFGGLILLLISKKLVKIDAVELASQLVLLTGLFIMVYALFSALWTGMRGQDKVEGASRGPTGPAEDTRPQGLPGQPMSVTENTTRIIDRELRAIDGDSHD